MERYYCIAGIRYKVTCPDRLMAEDGLLGDYRCEEGSWDQELSFELVAELARETGELVFRDPGRSVQLLGDAQLRLEGSPDGDPAKAYMRILRRGNHSCVQIRENEFVRAVSAKKILYAMELEHQLTKRGGLLLHASYIQVGDRGILFTAPSETGKSTQADLWVRYRGAELLNGDRAAVVPGEDGFRVCGVPFSGSSGISKPVDLPLAAVVYLSQGPESVITKPRGRRAMQMVLEGCSVDVWNREDSVRSIQTVTELLGQVPVYHLSCLPDESAVLALEEMLKSEGRL